MLANESSSGEMLSIEELQLGFSDAENYRRRENKSFFNKIFVRDTYLKELLKPSSFFLIGDKGTGKTAYSTFLANNNYENTLSEIKYIRETDYSKFIALKQQQHLGLSDYTSIWKVIILLLLSKSIKPDELNSNPFTKASKIKTILNAIDRYDMGAFSPEITITNALTWIENSKVTAGIAREFLNLQGERGLSISAQEQESRFQVNLLFIERQFKDALSNIKLNNNHLLFIDGIDIRPGEIEYSDYLECIKGLANAVWELNNDFFPQIRDQKGRFRVILLVRPDIFTSIGLQNTTNKVRDNSVYLDWRTTYPGHRTSRLFEMSDKLLSAQQDSVSTIGDAWDYYFPWKTSSAKFLSEDEAPFVLLLRMSYSRPRDIIVALNILKEEILEKNTSIPRAFSEINLVSHDFQTKYSEYLMGSIKDQLAFYYDSQDYELFLRFFGFLNGSAEFSYQSYLDAYNHFTEYIVSHQENVPEFAESPDKFIQFLYESNIICYIDYLEKGFGSEPVFRFCYRERSISNISPKVGLEKKYRIHYGLWKALNVGNYRHKDQGNK